MTTPTTQLKKRRGLLLAAGLARRWEPSEALIRDEALQELLNARETTPVPLPTNEMGGIFR